MVLALNIINTFFVAFMQTTFYTASAFYYVPVLKMSLTWASAANALSSLLGIFCTIFVGWFGDRVVSSRFGKRKPLVAGFYPLMAVASLAIYYPPFSSVERLSVQAWYLLCIMVFQVGSTCYTQVIGSWFIESCSSGDDYMRLSIAGSVAGAIGALLGVVCSSVLRLFGPPSILASILGSCSIILILLFVPSRNIGKASVQPPLLASYRVLSRTSEYKTVLTNKTILMSAYQSCGEFLLYICFMAFEVKHFQSVLGFYTVYAIVAIVGIVPVVAVLGWMMRRKWEKISLYKTCTMALASIAAALLVLYLPGLTVGSALPDSTYLALFDLWMALIIVASLFYSGAMFLEGLIARDLIRFDTYRTGLNRENLYQTALNVPAQCVAQILTAVPMSVFTASGFSPYDGPPPTDDLIKHKYSWTFGSQVQIVVYSTVLFGSGALYSWYIFNRYPLVQSVADKIEAALNRRVARQAKAQRSRQSAVVFGGVKAEGRGEDKDSEGAEAGRGDGNDDNDYDDDISQLSDGLSSIADNNDEMLFSHFSQREIFALAKSEQVGGSNAALGRVTLFHRLNLYLVGPATMACLLAGLYYQMAANSQLQVVVVNLLCFSSLFVMYEFLRLGPLREVGRLSAFDVLLKAKAAHRALSSRQETLKEMLARSGIEAEDGAGLRESLAAPAELLEGVGDGEGEQGWGVGFEYARLFAVQAVLAALGILAAALV